ncbi:oxidoreductase [Hyaloraphidium curvatum]|nr:oxidoreductase [Hyaloraphidium curvatum]
MTPPPSRGRRLLNHSNGAGRVCFITGASSPLGMGHASAVLLAREGARVVVSDLPKLEEQGRKVVEEIEKEGGKAIWVPLDVAEESQWPGAIAAAEQAFGPLDVMVANAGIAMEYESYTVNEGDSLMDHPTADWRKILAVNQDGVYFAIKYGGKSMLKNPVKEGKSIIVISSTAGFTGQFGFAYTASKFAVRGMTKHAAAYMARHNIRVNSVHPNFIRTSIPAPFFLRGGRKPTREEIQKVVTNLQNGSPQRRWGTPEEVAYLIAYLASDESSFTTGTEHVLDGGFLTVAGYGENPFKVESKL